MSLTKVLEGDFGLENAKEDQMNSWKLAEIDYLDLDVFEPDLSEEDGLVASAGNEEDFGSLNDFSENSHKFNSDFWSYSLELS